MKDRLTRLAAEAKCYNLRPVSDDYRDRTIFNPAEATPDSGSYRVTIGDVSIRFTSVRGMVVHQRADYISLSCDNVLMVKFDALTSAIEWTHHSAALEAYFETTLDTLLLRITARKAEAALRAAQQKAAEAALVAEREAGEQTHEAAVLARFGITKAEVTA